MPAVYPIWAIGIVGGLIGFFTGTGNVFEFFGLSAPSNLNTIGYIMFTSVKAQGDYGFNAAGSLVFSVIVAPLALTAKHLLFKYGPSDS